MSHDVVGIGEAMVRLSAPRGTRLENADHFEIHVGGAEANVAVAIARMGRSAAWISRLPDSPLGRRTAADIARHGVDVSAVTWTDTDRMGIYFADPGSPPRPTAVLYDRVGSAAGQMVPADVDWAVVEAARLLHLTGITPALGDGCRQVVTTAIERARGAGTLVAFDVNYRAKLWSVTAARETLQAAASGIDVLIATAEDARDVFGVQGDARAAAAGLAELLSVDRVAVTEGSRGAAWFDRGSHGNLDAFAAVEVDRIGGGDAFAAGVLLGVLDDDLPSGVECGLAMAAIKLGIKGDQFIADPPEVAALLEQNGRSVAR